MVVATTTYVFSATLTLARPTDTADGELLIAWIRSRSNRLVSTPPSGWSLLTEPDTFGLCRTWIYTKTASSEPASWDWVFDNTQHQLGAALRIPGASRAINAGGTINGNTAVTSLDITAITPTQAGSLLLALYAAGSDDSPGPQDFTHPSGMTELVDLTGDFITKLGVAYEEDVAASSTGAKTFSYPTATNLQGTLLAVDPEEVAEPQVVRPVSTTNAGAWTAVGAASLHEAVDEETASFTDYIHSEDDPTDSPVVLRLGSLAEPSSAPGDDDVVVHVQYDKEGGAVTTNLTLELRQGYTNEGSPGTLIASSSDADVTDAAEDGTISLTAVEAANITYTGGVASDLDVRIVADIT